MQVSNIEMQAKRIRRRLRGVANGRNAAQSRAKVQNRLVGASGGSPKTRADDPALVGMLTVTVVEFIPTCTLAGITEHVFPLGSPEQDKEAVPV
jgi:hypothetical protein